MHHPLGAASDQKAWLALEKSALKLIQMAAVWRPQGFIPPLGTSPYVSVFTTWHLTSPRASAPRKSEGENSQDKSPNNFCNLILELGYHYFQQYSIDHIDQP